MNKVCVLIFLLFFCHMAFSDDVNKISGKFVIVKGLVSVLHLNNQTEKAKVGTSVSAGDTVIAESDSRAKIVMIDRNVINVFSDSKVKIEKYDHKDPKNVDLSLIEGRIRANVEQSYSKKDSHFIIKTKSAQAGVRGTEFLVSYDRLTRVTEVITFRGAVNFGNITSLDKDRVSVKRGQVSRLSADDVRPEIPKNLPKNELNQINIEYRDVVEVIGDSSKGITEPEKNIIDQGPLPGSSLTNDIKAPAPAPTNLSDTIKERTKNGKVIINPK